MDIKNTSDRDHKLKFKFKLSPKVRKKLDKLIENLMEPPVLMLIIFIVAFFAGEYCSSVQHKKFVKYVNDNKPTLICNQTKLPYGEYSLSCDAGGECDAVVSNDSGRKFEMNDCKFVLAPIEALNEQK